MNADLTAVDARTQRDRLADQVGVLTQVKELAALPGDTYCSTLIVADFYEVDPSSIRTLIDRHGDEFKADGYRTVTRSDVKLATGLTWNELGFPAKSHTAALFPRRAVLRIGMLLRDSVVARKVRDYLLDTEAAAVPVMPSGPELIAHAVIEAQKMLAAKDQQISELAEKIAEDAPKVNYVELYVADTDLLKLRTVAANNDVPEHWLRDLLVSKGWIYVETESRWSNSKGCMEIRRRYSAYSHKRQYFRPVEVHEAPRFKGEVMHTLKVTPAGAEAVARLITKERAA